MNESIDINQYKIMFNRYCFTGELNKLTEIFNIIDINLILSDIEFIDNCFSSATFRGKFDIIQQLYSWFPNFTNNNFTKLFIYACNNFNIDLLDLIISKNPNKTISYTDFEESILAACIKGNLNILKKIIEFYSNQDDDPIDLCFDDNQPLKNACEFGNFDIVLYLLDNFPDICISNDNEDSFFLACKSGNFELVKLLFEREPNINISVNNNSIIKHLLQENLYEDEESNFKNIILFLVQNKPDILNSNSIRFPKDIIEFFNLNGFHLNTHWLDIFIKIEDQLNPFQCNICYQNIFDFYIKTPCNHGFCSDCINQWVEINNVCPYCRTAF